MSFMDDRVQLTLGLRRQSVEAESFDTATGERTSRYDKSVTTGAVTLLVRPMPDLSIYGNYIEGLQRGSVAPNTADNAGEIFPPFVSKQYEIGMKRDFGNFSATLAAYQITFPSAFTDPATNVFGINGEVRHRGLEFGAFGKVGENVRLLGGLQWLDSVQTETLGGVNQGNKDWGAADVQANLGVEWDTPFLRGLTLTARGIYTSSQYVDKANLQKIPAWTSIDIGARYAMKAGSIPVVIRATIQNAFDKSYWSQGFSQLSVSTPRTLTLSATFDF